MIGGYNPAVHWTSNLRVRAGLRPCSVGGDQDKDMSPFTTLDQRTSQSVTDFLVRLGHREAAGWRDSGPHYHIEVAVSNKGESSPFVWSLSSFRR